MTGKELKLQFEAFKLQQKSKDVIVQFLDKHLNKDVFDNIWNTQSWLNEIYPAISEESEQDEQLISAFVARMVFIMINTPGTGVRWIYTVPPEDTEEDTERNDQQ